ncbi:hypothetical protein MMC08_001426 [Hypocenomyce scalaris]|nr:hypothetical protein [Hypocenomyce scalaris]
MDKEVIPFPDHEFEVVQSDELADIEETLTKKGPEGISKPTKLEYQGNFSEGLSLEDGIYTISDKSHPPHTLNTKSYDNTECASQSKKDAAYTRGKEPFPSSGKHYFEVTVLELGDEKYGILGIGLANDSSKRSGIVGWNPGSWGYHSDDGTYRVRAEESPSDRHCNQIHGPAYTQGNIAVCGFDAEFELILFTKNGWNLVTFAGVDQSVYPVVSIHGKPVRVKVNFREDESMWKGTPWDGIKLDIK